MKKVALILSFIGSLLSFVAIIVLILEKTHVRTVMYRHILCFPGLLSGLFICLSMEQERNIF